jgi:hypothetical protein
VRPRTLYPPSTAPTTTPAGVPPSINCRSSCRGMWKLSIAAWACRRRNHLAQSPPSLGSGDLQAKDQELNSNVRCKTLRTQFRSRFLTFAVAINMRAQPQFSLSIIEVDSMQNLNEIWTEGHLEPTGISSFQLERKRWG